jgi:RNA polymerase sigma-70 factor (ECF subfamily)
VAKLPDRQRTAVVLRYVADLPEADIAAAMKVSRGTVASTLSDARKALARHLSDENEPQEVGG